MKKLEHLLLFTMLTIGCACLHTGCTYDEFLSATKPCGAGAHWDFDFETGALKISGEGAVEGTPYAESMKPNITSVTISEGITNIGDSVFIGCDNITSVLWNARNCNRTIFCHSDRVFDEYGHPKYDENREEVYNTIDSVASFVFGEQVEVIPARICACMKKITEINIPNSATTIEQMAFYYCQNLSNVTLGNQVKTIGTDAFSNCSRLSGINIPNCVTEIGERAFLHCDNLKEVTIGDWVENIGKSAFNQCTNLDSVTIGERVTNIGAHAFRYCENIRNISLPKNIMNIGDYAFYGCKNLTKVNNIYIHRILNIDYGKYAFSNCSSLTYFLISTNNRRIEKHTFDGCTNLKEVVIFGVDTIFSDAFYGCNLEKVTCYAENPPKLEGSSVFRRNDWAKIENLYVPSGSVNAYKESGWANYFVNILPK